MKSILITGGAGFIGVNSALYFAENGWSITILDNLSRRGTKGNLRWLQDRAQLQFRKVDIRDQNSVERTVAEAKPDVLLHLAASAWLLVGAWATRERSDEPPPT